MSATGNGILVIGSANADYVMTADRMPAAGETLHGNAFRIQAGGKGLNQAVAAAKLGGKVTFLGAVGADGNGAMLRGVLERSNVTFEEIRCEDATTGIAMIVVAEGDNRILLHAGANARLTPSVVQRCRERIEASEYVVLQLEIPPETVRAVCAIAAESGTKVVLNPAPAVPLDAALCRQVELLIPNEHEAQVLTGVTVKDRASAETALCRLLALGVKQVIITLGEQGCVYTDGTEIVHQPAIRVDAVDTTSAGDCFIGATVARLAAGASLREAIVFASKAAAITVSREGAADSIPLAEDVE